MRNTSIVYMIRGENTRRRRVAGLGLSVSMHVTALTIVASFAATGSAASHRGRNRSASVTVFTTPGLPAAPPTAPPAEAGSRVADDLGLRVDSANATVDLSSFRFNFSKVIGRAAALFPFVTGSPLLDDLVKGGHIERKHGVDNPFARGNGRPYKPPLTMSSDEVQRVVDASWSRRDRWELFGPVATLLEGFDPNQGTLPSLLRAYAEENGLQPYVDRSVRDPRLWVQLGLVADHVQFLKAIADFVRQNPRSRSTTELLFLADKITQGSYDALVTLLDIEPERDLLWTRRANPQAYRALVVIRDYYRQQLAKRGLTAPHAIRAFYDAIRLRILDRIISTTPDGYRRNDALFLAGEIDWRDDRHADALSTWAVIVPDVADTYFIPSTALLEVIHRQGRASQDKREIETILSGEQGRWLMSSLDRLQLFGYHLDTF